MFELGPTPTDPMDLLEEPVGLPTIHLYNGKENMVPWVRKNTDLGRVLVPTKAIPNQPGVPTPDYTGFIRADIPTMPQSILNTAAAFFRFVLDTAHTEAALLIALDEDRNYHLHCPEQEVDYTGVDWKDDIELPDDQHIIGSIHSHCDFSAFHSGTDEGDAAKNDGLHITLGKLDDDVPEVDVMVSFSGVKWQKWDLSDFLEGETWDPPKAEDDDQVDLIDIEWLNKLKEPVRPQWVKKSWSPKSVRKSAQHASWSSDDWDEWDDEDAMWWDAWNERHIKTSEDLSADKYKSQDSNISYYRRINEINCWYSEDKGTAQDQIYKDLSDLVLLASEVGMTISFSIHGWEPGNDVPLLPEMLEKETTHASAK